jgi:ferritin-like metal-binding protein YciE
LLVAVDKQLEFEVLKMQNQMKEYFEQTKKDIEEVFAILEPISKMYEGVDPKAISGMIENLSKVNKINEKVLVDAVLDKQKAKETATRLGLAEVKK